MRFLLCLCLLAALMSRVLGAPVDPNNPNGIAAIHHGGDTPYDNKAWVLCTNGDVYVHGFNYNTEWILDDGRPPLPVPLEEIADWGPRYFLTTSGQIWMYDSGYGSENYFLVDNPCEGAVNSEQRRLGDVKELFR